MEAFALLVIVLIAVWTQGFLIYKFAFHNLDYQCYFSTAEAVEGQEITFTEVLHNNKPLPLQWVKAEIRTSKWLSFADTRSYIAQEIRHVTSGFHLRLYQRTTRIWKVKCLKRGVFTIDNVILVTSDLFGSNTKSVPYPAKVRLTVLPGMVDLEDILNSTRNLQGDIIVKRWILDDPFIIAGAKEYTYTEPMNRIHWQATARHSDLMVRKNDFTSNQSIRVVLNIQTVEYYHPYTIDKDLIEYGIKIAGTLFDRGLKLGIPMGFASNGSLKEREDFVFTSSGNGSLHVSQLLTTLAQLDFKINIGFDEFFGDISPRINESEVIIITPYLEDSLNDMFNSLTEKGIAVKIILLSEVYKPTNLNNDIPVYTIKAGDSI